MIKPCGCGSDTNGNKLAANFQDKLLGQGQRYFTEKQDGRPAKCTVCGKEYKETPKKK